MIFNYHKLSQIKKLALIMFIMICHFDSKISAGPPVGAQLTAQNLRLSKKPSFSQQINHFLDHLIKASEDESIQIFGKYRTAIANHLDLQKLYFASYHEVEELLEIAVAESIDSLTLFTLPLLQNQTAS